MSNIYLNTEQQSMPPTDNQIEGCHGHYDKTQRKPTHFSRWMNLANNFDNFLEQPLKLEMFVPCDNDEEILKPQYIAGKEVIYNELVEEFIMDKVKEYNEAKEKVLFEGFNLNQKDFSKLESIFCLTKECFQITFFTKEKGCFMDNLKTNKTYEIKTIEDLIQFELELTESAIKQIGL